MSEGQHIESFLAEPTVALIGASRDPRALSSVVRRELEARGTRVFAVNPSATADGFFSSLAALPEKVGAALVLVPPRAAEAVVNDALASGVKRIWLHQGSVSAAAVRVCEQAGVDLVKDRCILMFLDPVRSVHRFHRGVLRLFGRLPR